MRIIADENIPLIREACDGFGDVELLPGRDMTPETIRDAECLFVRSVTMVNADLLEGSAVRFVGTATIGTDHVDRAWLDERGIGFASAPGSNANSVSEYVTSALLTIAVRNDMPLAGKTVGVVGVGNVGSRVAAKAEALGTTVLRNDPPRAEAEGSEAFVELDELLSRADVVTLHTPLEREGAHPTFHLADETFFKKLKRGAIFVNSSRGKVHDTRALVAALDDGAVAKAVLDVWENEPSIEFDLLDRVAVATPHIAGYSYDGKVNGTAMIVAAARQFFGVDGAWDPAPCMPEPDIPELDIDVDGRDDEAVLHEAVNTVCNVTFDDAGMRIIPELPDEDAAAYFDRLRKEYHPRREFHNTLVRLTGATPATAGALRALGFRVETR